MTMEAITMKQFLMLVAALVLLGNAQASEVFKTKDAKGNTIYTDRPDLLPAEKLKLQSKSTDPATAEKRYDEQMKRYAADDKVAGSPTAEQRKASVTSAEDLAKRCQDARARYDGLMNSRRIYEDGEKEGERRYLSDQEAAAARANAKQTMDEFCSGQ
jgi:DNA helicase IV